MYHQSKLFHRGKTYHCVSVEGLPESCVLSIGCAVNEVHQLEKVLRVVILLHEVYKITAVAKRDFSNFTV